MIRRIGVGLAMALLCVGVSANPLPLPLAPNLPVELVMSQHELAVDVSGTAGAMGAQFGLIGALIGAGIQNAQVKKAEQQVVPMRNLLLDYRFNDRVEAALRSKLASDGVSPAPQIKVMQTPWDAVDAVQNKQDMPLHALVVVPRYAIDAGFTSLSVSLLAQVVDRTVKSNGKVKTRYAFSRNYAFHFPLTGPNGDSNAQRWTSMGAARVEALLDQGIAQAADMMVYDFSAEGRAQWDQKTRGESAAVKGITYPGHAVRQTPDWVWVRNAGTFVVPTLQGYQPVNESDVSSAVAASPAMGATPTPALSGAVAPAVVPAANVPAVLPVTPANAVPVQAAGGH